MAVIIFVNGIRAVNGLVKSSINTANAFAEEGLDVHLINFVGNITGAEHLSPPFHLHPNVKTSSIIDLFNDIPENVSCRNIPFYSIHQQFFKAEYSAHYKHVLMKIESLLSEEDSIIFTHPLQLEMYRLANNNIKSKAKLIVQIHGNYMEEIHNYEILARNIDYVDYLQTVSDEMLEEMHSHFKIKKDKLVFIPNITYPISLEKKEADFFIKDNEDIDNAQKFKRISIVGSIQPRKNQLDAIKIINKIKNENYILQIYGKSINKDYFELIKKYIKDNKLQNRILFKGESSEQEIYENTDILIMTSQSEGFGYIFLEGMVYDIPILAYNFKYGANDFSNYNENASVFKTGDISGMAKKIIELLNNPEKYKELVQYNHNRFLKEYAKDVVMAKYFTIFPRSFNNVSLSSAFSRKELDEFQNITFSIEDSNDLAHIWNFELTNPAQNMNFFALVGKRKFPMDAHIQGTQCTIKIAHKKTGNLLSLLLKKRNQLNLSRGYTLIAEDNSYEKYIGAISNKGNFEIIANKKNSLVTINKSTLELHEIPHELHQNKLLIALPNMQTPLKITDDNLIPIQASIKLEKIGNTYYPCFLPSGIFNNICLDYGEESKIINFSKYSYKYIYDSIRHIEQHTDISDIIVCNVYSWELIRASVIESLMEFTGKWEKHFQTSPKIDYRFDHEGKRSMDDVFSEETFIMEFPRKNGIDKKTAAFQNIPNSIVMEYPQTNGYGMRSHSLKSNVVAAKHFLEKLNKIKVDIKFKKHDLANIKKMNRIIYEHLGININIEAFLKPRLEKFKREEKYFHDFFKRNNFKEVIFPSTYWNPGIICAAHKQGIKVSDIQYAAITPYHPAYFKSPKSHYVADKLFLWSEYWNHELLPNPTREIGSGAAYWYALDDVRFSEKLNYDYIFLSQSRISSRLLSFAIEFALKNPQLQLLFSKHPDENIDLKNRIIPDNLIISTESSIQGINESRVAVGVYSTSLFEALACGKQTFVVKYPGYEIMSNEIDSGLFFAVETPEEMLEKTSPNWVAVADIENQFFGQEK